MKYENPTICHLLMHIYNGSVVGAFLYVVTTNHMSLWWTLIALLFLIGYRNDNDVDQDLRLAAINLRIAQKAYMADRGNEELGRQVAQAAEELDEVLKGEND